MFPFWFTLNEQGVVVQENELRDDLLYGSLGPLPDVMGDTLYFAGDCPYEGGEGFIVRAKLWPALTSSRYSNLEFTIVPATDCEQGIVYNIRYSEQFDFVVDDLSDWPRYIRAGDTLTVKARLKPLRPGIGSFRFLVLGLADLRMEGDDSYHPVAGGAISSDLSATLVVDERLNLIAYTLSEISNLNANDQRVPEARQRNDEFRLEQVQEFRVDTAISTINSASFESIKGAAVESTREKRQYRQ